VGARDHDAGRDGRVEGLADAVAAAVDELRGRVGLVLGVDRPVVVVEVEHRVDRDEVHLGVVVRVDRPDVAPVAPVAVGRAGHQVVAEVVDGRLTPGHEVGDDVAAHVVLAALALAVADHGVLQRLGSEDVVAHRGEDLVGAAREPPGVGGLLPEGGDPPGVGCVHLDDPELVGERDRLADRRDRDSSARLDVLVDHLAEVHAVDVVGADDHDDLGPLVVDEVEALEDRVGAAEVPVLVDPLLGRDGRDVVAQESGHPPGLGHVRVEAVRLVLREDDDLEVAGVDDVAQGEVDEAVDARERDGRFGPVGGQRQQALALTPCEHDGEDLRTS
jgi:hypothetical protein